MPKKLNKTETPPQRRERLLLEGWQEDLDDYLISYQFSQWVQKNYPDIAAEFHSDKGLRHYFGSMESIDHNIEGYKDLTQYHTRVRAGQVGKNALKKDLTQEALAKRLAIRKSNKQKTTLTELAYCFEVDEKTLRSFVKREFNLDWKSYLRKVLED